MEWLDRYPWIPVLFLILLPFLVELPLIFLGLSTNPIWQQSGIVEGVKAGFLPGLSYADPNVGWTTQALGHLAAEDWLHGTIPWWNPYSGIGLPLAGEMQPNAFFLPFVFLLLLHNGVLWLKIAMQIMAGLATFALLRELKLGRLTALTGGVLYALNSTFAWMPGETICNTIPFLPLLLYGIERSRRAEGIDGIIWIALAISGSLYAGFPEAAYINGLFGLAWATYRFFTSYYTRHFLANVVAGGVIGLLLSAPIINAFLGYLINTNAYHMHSQYAAVFLDFRDISIYLFPYIYGPIGSTLGKSFLIKFWGEGTSYVGIIVFSFASLSIAVKNKDKIYLLLLIYIFLSFIRIFGFPGYSIINSVPLLSETMFTRYSYPSWGLALIVLAMFALDRLDQKQNVSVMALSVAFIVSVFLVSLQAALEAVTNNKFILTSILYSLFMLTIIFVFYSIKKLKKIVYFSAIIIANCIIMFIVPELSGVHAGQVDKPGLKFLRSNIGLYRFYTLGPIEPNYSAYFDISTINYNYLPIDSSWANYIDKNIFPQLPKSSGVIFWAPWYGAEIGVSDLTHFLRNYENIGVRYVITNNGQSLRQNIFFPTRNSGNIPYVLDNNSSVSDNLNINNRIKKPVYIGSISVFQGNYANTANGQLSAKVCTKTNDCSVGSRPLSQSHDNSLFSIKLVRSLRVVAGQTLTISFIHTDSTKPEAIWLWPQTPGDKQMVVGPHGQLRGRAIQLSLNYSDSANTGIRKVYSDDVMNIWELPHPAPYYTVLRGQCTLSEESLDGVAARCTTPATLLRRELFMPGWTATVDGAHAAVTAHEKIFQVVHLPAGDSVVRFRFAPPYAGYAWIAFWGGLAGLAWTTLSWWKFLTGKKRKKSVDPFQSGQAKY